MKISHYALLAVVSLITVVAVTNRSAAEPDDSGARVPVDQYSHLVSSLSQRGDTNTLAQITKLITAMQQEQSATELGISVRVLADLRSGKTNEALRMLETQLDGALTQFAFKHNPNYDKILARAKEYRSKYPYKSGSPEVDAAVARTFDSLPK